MKKVLSLFLSILMLCSITAGVDLSVQAAAKTYTSGKWTYTVSNKEATITGYSGSPSSLTIPSKLGGYSVTKIGEDAFFGFESLTSVTIPDSVTSLDSCAFAYCINLSSIKMPNSITSIGPIAFRACSSLASITIPSSVDSIGDCAFSDCTSLKSIAVDSGNKNYSSKEGTLFNKKKTKLICYPAGKTASTYTIPSTVTSIGSEAFINCTSLKSVTIPNSITSIGESAFADCVKLTNIVIPNSVTVIGGGAFSNCTNLVSLTIPNSVTSIGSCVFSCTGLTSITIPNSVKSIGEFAFENCKGLTSITIPNSVTKISQGAFYDCESLKSITIPNSVKSIGECAFQNCKGLTSITIPNSVTKISQGAFYDCESLKSITIPNSVTSIGSEAFYYCTSLTSAVIGSGVTKISSYAFIGCEKLKKVTIPSSVTKISEYAFDGCSALKTVYYLGTESQWGKISISDGNSELKGASIIYGCSHKYGSAKYSKATTSTKGYKISTCTVCGAQKTSSYAKIKSISLSTSSYTYNGKAKKPTVTVKDSKGNTISSDYYTVTYVNQSTGKEVSQMKSVGKYYVKVKFKTKYSGTVKKTVTIKPKSTSISSLSASSKGFTVKWSKVTTQTTGYQIQYSTSSDFSSKTTKTISSNSTTSKKITGLKAKKKYYVRVRTYKTVKIDGKSTKIYSSWSSTKTVTTKK